MKRPIFLFVVAATLLQLSTQAQNWQPLSGGMTGTTGALVLALYSDGTTLYAGGIFDNAGGVSAESIAKWDGTSWSPMGQGMPHVDHSTVRSITKYQNTIYAGGAFVEADNNPVYYITEWNGTEWVQLPGILGFSHPLLAMTEYNGELYMAGGHGFYYTTDANNDYTGAVISKIISRWDGSNMNTVEGFTRSNGAYINALTVYNGELYAAGSFYEVDGEPGNNIAKWNGSSWSSVGSGTNAQIMSLVVYNGELYAGGEFTSAGGVPVQGIAKWNGVSWSAVGTVNMNYTGSLTVYNGNLYAGGYFNNQNNGPCMPETIAMLYDNDWIIVGDGLNNFVRTLTVHNGDLIAGGTFLYNADGSTTLNHIGKFNHGAGNTVANVWYADADGDGYGTGNATIACTQPSNSSAVNGDCDDSNAGIHPGAAEVCGNGTDENCNGFTNEGCCLMTVNAGIDEQTFFGYTGDQSVTHTASISGGTAPYTYAWSLSRPLNCNQVNATGDETFSGGTCSDNICGANSTTAAAATCTGSASVTAKLTDDAIVCVIVTDANGCTATDCFNIDAQDARCFAGNSNNVKVKVCHHTNSNSNPWVQICIAQSAVSAHLSGNSGDYLGTCGAKLDDESIVLTGSGEVNMAVYPNPSRDNVNIEFEATTSEAYSVALFDVTGRMVMTNEGDAYEGGNRLALPLNNLVDGVYLIRLTIGNQSSNARVVVAK